MSQFRLWLCLFVGWMALCQLSAQVTLNRPESAIYSPQREGYFISNVESGQVLFQPVIAGGYTLKTQLTVFKDNLSGPMGLELIDNTLYVADGAKGNDHIYGFDLDSGEQVFDIQIPGAGQLNDLTWDGEENLYVTDRKGNEVYRVDYEAGSFQKLEAVDIPTPNGLIYDPTHHRLLVVNSVENAGLYEIDLKTDRSTLILASTNSNFDGIAIDFQDRVYISSWGADWKHSMVLVWEASDPEKLEVILKNEKGIADLSFNPYQNELVLPCWWTQQLNRHALFQPEANNKIKLKVNPKKGKISFSNKKSRLLTASLYSPAWRGAKVLYEGEVPAKKVNFGYPEVSEKSILVISDSDKTLISTPLQITDK